jgi:hypothetical protein
MIYPEASPPSELAFLKVKGITKTVILGLTLQEYRRVY